MIYAIYYDQTEEQKFESKSSFTMRGWDKLCSEWAETNKVTKPKYRLYSFQVIPSEPPLKGVADVFDDEVVINMNPQISKELNNKYEHELLMAANK